MVMVRVSVGRNRGMRQTLDKREKGTPEHIVRKRDRQREGDSVRLKRQKADERQSDRSRLSVRYQEEWTN